MIVKLQHRLDITAGSTPGALMATPRLIAADGSIAEEGATLPLAAGQSVLYGPIDIKVTAAGAFSTGPTPANGTPAPGTAENPIKVPGPVPQTRR